jgi:glutamate racemase
MLRTYDTMYYVALMPLIQQFIPEESDILTQAKPVEERLIDWLRRHPEFEIRMSKTGTRRLLTTDDQTHFSQIAYDILGIEIKAETLSID